MGKSSSSRDSQPDDLDTVLVISSEEIAKARAQVESVSSETGTADCHPVILDDSEEDTDRFVGNDASSSGLVKNPLKVNAKSPPRPDKPRREPDADPETSTDIALPQPLPTLLDEEEEIEISASGIIAEDEGGSISDAEQTPTREPIVGKVEPPPGKAEPRATITEVREVEPTEEKPKPKKVVPRFDDETKPMPKPNLVDIGGALETVPLNAALVQNVLAQVDARAAARASGQPVPHFQVPNARAQPAVPLAHATPRQGPTATMGPTTHRGTPMPAPRGLGMEIFITVAAFLFVAVPALYYLYVTLTQ